MKWQPEHFPQGTVVEAKFFDGTVERHVVKHCVYNAADNFILVCEADDALTGKKSFSAHYVTQIISRGNGPVYEQPNLEKLRASHKRRSDDGQMRAAYVLWDKKRLLKDPYPGGRLRNGKRPEIFQRREEYPYLGSLHLDRYINPTQLNKLNTAPWSFAYHDLEHLYVGHIPKRRRVKWVKKYIKRNFNRLLDRSSRVALVERLVQSAEYEFESWTDEDNYESERREYRMLASKYKFGNISKRNVVIGLLNNELKEYLRVRNRPFYTFEASASIPDPNGNTVTIRIEYSSDIENFLVDEFMEVGYNVRVTDDIIRDDFHMVLQSGYLQLITFLSERPVDFIKNRPYLYGAMYPQLVEKDDDNTDYGYSDFDFA